MQKLSVQQLPSVFKDLVSVSYNSTANKLTFTSVKGDVLDVELSPKDNYVLDVTYNSTTHKVKVDYLDGTSTTLDTSDLYNIYTGVDGAQVKVEVGSDNKIKATIKDASITRDKFAQAVTDELDQDAQDIDDLKKAISAINNKSDSSSLGDTAVLPLVDGCQYIWQPQGASRTASADFKDEYAFGYVFTGPQAMYQGRKFNRVKVLVVYPGWFRMGIVRGTFANECDGVARGFASANPTYETTDVYPVSLISGGDGSDTTADGKSHKALKKWLICRYVTTPGLHEFDIPDEVITSPFEYVFVECRSGISGFAFNKTGAAITDGDITIANNYQPNALAVPTQFVSKTYFGSGSWAMSNNMLDASCRITYLSYNNGGVARSLWGSIYTDRDTELISSKNGENYGWLNIGLYERGSGSSIVLNPLTENVFSNSSLALGSKTVGNAINCWTPDYEAQLELSKYKWPIYAIDIFVSQPGDLTVYHMSGSDPATAYVKNCWTLRIRAIGPQRIHLPEEVILEEGEYIGFCGATEALFHTVHSEYASASASTKLTDGYVDNVRFLFGAPAANNFTSVGDDPTGVQDCRAYDIFTESQCINEFRYWEGVKLTGDERKFDFTNATFNISNTNLNIGLVVRRGKISKVEDWNVSVTGDSISTYRGIVSKTTDWGGITNAAGDNAICYPDYGCGFVNSPDGTWWGKFIKDNRARLIRNDAWSGSKVSGTDSATSSTAAASQIRTKMLHGTQFDYTPNTTTGLGHPFGYPQLILCMIGTNDLAGNTAAGAYSNTAPTDISTILGAFETMVARHKTNYPAAKLVYFMIPRGTTFPYQYTNANGFSIAQMASSFEYIAKSLGAYFVPLSYFNYLEFPMDNSPANCTWCPTAGFAHPREGSTHMSTTDRLHPTAIGHTLIANALTRFIENNF